MSHHTSVLDPVFLVTGSASAASKPSLWYVLSLGRSQVYKSTSGTRWQKVSDDEMGRLTLEIPRDTLLICEIVQELRGEGKGQRSV